jgi:hypothetical protein
VSIAHPNDKAGLMYLEGAKLWDWFFVAKLEMFAG